MFKSRRTGWYRNSTSVHTQRGAALIVALVFLLLMTILALSASSRSLLQERMAGGLRNAQQAEMSAETALRGAEWQLWSRTSTVGGHMDCLSSGISSDDGCVIYNPANTSLYGASGTVTVFRTSQAWITGGLTYLGPLGGYTNSSTNPNFSQLAQNPVYIIEDMGRELPPGSGPQHESGDTGPNNTGAGQVDTHIFRITARATGGNENAIRVMQSTFDAQAQN
ncbi:MAG: PilX N-terminal domain-containing pilus assembly protein [Rhodanobacter sp.]